MHIGAVGGTAANKAAAESNKPGGFTAGAIGRGPDLSQHLEGLSAWIEECSKGQRREFLKMKKRLDSMLSQNWSEGAQLRSEMMELTTALKALVLSNSQNSGTRQDGGGG